MSGPEPRPTSRARPRLTRAQTIGALVCVIGLLATSFAYVTARRDVDRFERRSLDRAASAALLRVQSLNASVDQVLSTANGAVAASNLDPARFAEVLGPDIEASPTLSGMALLLRDATGAMGAASTVGTTRLLGADEMAAAETASGQGPRLVAWRHGSTGYTLGFVAPVARDAGAAYLEVDLPMTASRGDRFVLARDVGGTGGERDLVLGTVATTSGLVPWGTPVTLGGTELRLLVAPGRSSTGLFGIPLPTLILVAGLVLTAAAVALAIAWARRREAVITLGHENRALDEALARSRAMEAKLRSSEARFRSILRNTPGIIATIDPGTGSCRVLNRRDLLGHPIDEVRDPGGLTALVHEDDADDAAAFLTQLDALAPDEVCETTLRLVDAGGAARYVRFRVSAVTSTVDSGRGRRLLLGLMSDITEDAERQLHEAELEDALQRSQRLDAVGQLASGVAHDFNNLLMVVLGYSEILSDEPLSAEAHEYVTEIRRVAGRGAALVRQLLAFGKRDRAQPEPLDLNEVVREMEPLLTRTLGAAVQLQLVVAGQPSPIVADPVLIEQVVLNLALNARDAMPDGGVLYLATEHVPSEPGAEDRVALSVTDTGTGIDPAVRDTLFEPFVTTKEVGKGTGLGLATVASIVDAMGGSIEVASAPGQGTTFEIALPLRGEVVPAMTDETLVTAPPGSGQRVLVVEDETAVRNALTKLLCEHGYVAMASPGAEDALRMLDASSFDVVLSDVIMPNMTGVELLEHVRATRPALPVILMSGNSGGLFDEHAADGAVCVLRKPFARGELFRAVHDALTTVPADSVG